MRPFFVPIVGLQPGVAHFALRPSILQIFAQQVIAMSAYKQIELCFERIGARAKIGGLGKHMPHRHRLPLAMDVIHDEFGECFDIRLARNVNLNVLDVQPRNRHLLLAASNGVGEDRFLFGHDELHWFVAGLPQPRDVFSPGAVDVREAKEALKPDLILKREAKRRSGKRPRKSDIFLRQGEWFFLPWPHASIDHEQVEAYLDSTSVLSRFCRPLYTRR